MSCGRESSNSSGSCTETSSHNVSNSDVNSSGSWIGSSFNSENEDTSVMGEFCEERPSMVVEEGADMTLLSNEFSACDIETEIECDDLNSSRSSGSELERERKAQYRKRKTLHGVLETISRLQIDAQAAILRRSTDYADEAVTETVMMSDVESANEAKLLLGLCNHLKLQLSDLRKSTDRNDFCSLVWSVCGDDILDEHYSNWFGIKIGRRGDRLRELMTKWLGETKEPLENRGRHRILSVETKQIIYNAWHEHSIVTVDRRNGRDQITMRKEEYD